MTAMLAGAAYVAALCLILLFFRGVDIVNGMRLGFAVGYTVPRWIEHQEAGIQVVELDRRTAENLERHIMEPPF